VCSVSGSSDQGRSGSSLALGTAHRPSCHCKVLKQPLSCGIVSGSPSPASKAAGTWRLTASWLTTVTVPPGERRAMSVRALAAPAGHRRSWPGARCAIGRAPLRDHRVVADAGPRPVITAGQAPRDAGLVEHSLAVPGQVDQGAAAGFSGTSRRPTSHRRVPPLWACGMNQPPSGRSCRARPLRTSLRRRAGRAAPR
jgi:hypothetical protein